MKYKELIFWFFFQFYIFSSLVVCQSLNTTFTSPGWLTTDVPIRWQNDASATIIIYFLHADGAERMMFSLPVAGRRRHDVMIDYVVVARDAMTKRLLPIQGQCSYVISGNESLIVITNTLWILRYYELILTHMYYVCSV